MKPQIPKQPNQVRGNQIECIKFIQCPLCYGCRAFSTHDLECIECSDDNHKNNICNKDLHKDDVVSKFISKDKIILEETIYFESEEI